MLVFLSPSSYLVRINTGMFANVRLFDVEYIIAGHEALGEGFEVERIAY